MRKRVMAQAVAWACRQIGVEWRKQQAANKREAYAKLS